MYSRTFSKAHREALSRAKLGTHHSAETRAKISNSLKARWAEVPHVKRKIQNKRNKNRHLCLGQ